MIQKILILMGAVIISSSATAQEPAQPTVDPKTPSPAVLDDELLEITPGPEMTLAQMLQAVEKRNLTLEGARIEIEKAQAQLKQSWALVLPGAQGSLVYMHNDHEDKLELPGGMSLGGPIIIRQQEDLHGALEIGMSLINAESWATISMAKTGVELAKMSIEDVRQQLMLGVAEGYYMSLLAREFIALNEEVLISSKHHLEVATARFEAGTGLRIDVIRAEVDVETARQDHLTARLSFDNARDALRTLIQMEELPMPVEPAPITPPTGDMDSLTSKALSTRPDIKAKQINVELMEKQLDVSWMQFLPTLSAGWGLQYQFTKPGNMGSPDASRWSLVFTLAVPIYNHFRYGDLDYKRASLRQAIIQQNEAEQNVGKEVRTAQRDFLVAMASSQIAERQATLAQEGLNLVMASYNAGTGSSLDVTDARRMLSSANINLLTKKLQAQIALLKMLKITGEDIFKLAS